MRTNHMRCLRTYGNHCGHDRCGCRRSGWLEWTCGLYTTHGLSIARRGWWWWYESIARWSTSAVAIHVAHCDCWSGWGSWKGKVITCQLVPEQSRIWILSNYNYDIITGQCECISKNGRRIRALDIMKAKGFLFVDKDWWEHLNWYRGLLGIGRFLGLVEYVVSM